MSDTMPASSMQISAPRFHEEPRWRAHTVLLAGCAVFVVLALGVFGSVWAVANAATRALIEATPIVVSMPEAPAYSAPDPVLPDVSEVGPFVGPAFVDSFTVTCATSATLIQPAGGAMIAYSCQTPASGETGGTTLVAVGDSAIADPAIGTRNSPVYSGDTIREFNAHARLEYCRADTGTVTVFCRALVSVSSAP